ncbi:MAG: flagellar motor switch protein FliN [Patescibacteria group bacterium]|nr:flagellar motor switch protein FliN [Patescibacteria group bacterium]
MPDDNLMDQSEIERLMSQANSGAAPAAKPAAKPAPAPADQALDQNEIEALLGRAPKAGPAPAAAAAEADADKLLGQDDIERLLSQAGKAPAAARQQAAASAAPAAVAAPPPKQETPAFAVEGDGIVAQEDVDYLLDQAERAIRSIDAGSERDLPQGVAAFRLEEFRGAPASTESATLDLIRDVELDLKIELGRTHMYLEDVLRLRKGSVVPLDKLAGDPVDVYVNERLVARGEVLVLNDSFCVRIAELIAGVGAGA